MRAKANGFTLIELMVALAVFAIAALTLLRMEGASISRTADLDQRLLREVVAQNLAAEWLTDPAPPTLGDVNGWSSIRSDFPAARRGSGWRGARMRWRSAWRAMAR